MSENVDDLDELRKELVAFKSNESARSLVAHVLATDPAVTRVVLAWPMTSILAWKRPTKSTPANYVERWQWLWTGIDYDTRDIASAAGLDLDRAERALNVAIAMRLIYPDGTIASKTRDVLDEMKSAGVS